MHTMDALVLEIILTIDSNSGVVAIIIEDSDDENEIAVSRSPLDKIFGLIVAFLLNFRILHNLSDHAVVLLLRFFKYIFLLISESAFSVPELKEKINLPQSIHGCYSFLSVNPNPCKEYIVCPGCHMLYDRSVQSLTLGTSLNPESARCSFVEFPNHPQRRFRQPCNTILLHHVQRKGRNEFRPRKLYYYFGLHQALSVLLSRPNFLNMCNTWHIINNTTDFVADITDGRVWKEIISKLSSDGQPNNILGILVNIDWFQPYKHVSYSIGVIYAVIINLPRCYRYKSENVIIIGIIPGPHEPKVHVNSYLGPFITELLELQAGQWFSTSVGNQFVKCAIVGLSSDIPATRKAAGFVGHSAKKACSRCLKDFPRIGDHMDCSGFNRSSWPTRTHTVHCQQAYRVLASNTKAARKGIEQIYGARYSVLFEIPYYDAIRFPVIDVMHNLFLGTTKNIMAIWKDREILTKLDFETIQQKVESLNVPMDVGRIPYKIDSGMSGLTADQWKNWACIYSMYSLHDILPTEHLNCWWLFVQASIIICQPVLSPSDIEKADRILLEFCQLYETLYGALSCTINLHLHCHLVECLRDYGPAHSTWCFSFERYNGILGGIPNNNRSIQVEKTMIMRFVQQMTSYQSYPHYMDELQEFFGTTMVGSVNDTHVSSETYTALLQYSTTMDLGKLFSYNSLVLPIGSYSLHALQPDEVQCLTQMYKTVFSNCTVDPVSCLGYRFARAKLGSKLLSSQMARSDRSSYICASWLSDSLGLDTTSPTNKRPGCIKYFLKHRITIQMGSGEKITIQSLLACVRWYKRHPERLYIPLPVTLWYPEFEPLCAASFMPICRIANRCAQVEKHMDFPQRSYNNGKVIVIIPL